MRRKRAVRRQVAPDPMFGSLPVARFINHLMWDGKRTTAQKLFYSALKLISEEAKEEGVQVFERAVANVKPVLEVRPRRVGGATYQIPMEVPAHRREALAIKWLIQAARARPEHRMEQRLARELMEAARNQGVAVKKKEDTHRMAEANRAFAHYRW